MKYTGKIVDSHLHIHGGYTDVKGFLEGMEALSRAVDYDQKNVAMTSVWDPEFIGQNLLGIAYKVLYPGTVYAYAGIDSFLPAGVDQVPPRRQAEQYREMGFDGIKLLELKPTAFQKLGGIDFSGPAYDELFDYLEAEQFPVLIHVGDPRTFWDVEACPDFARENGWFYGQGGFPTLDELQANMERALRRHPKLQVVLAHFYFLSDNIGRAEEILRTYPNVRFDITPGTEMYENFSKAPNQWRSFFCRYAGRILFGTDNGWYSMMPMEEKISFAEGNVRNIRRFLETDDAFEGYGFQIRGIDLPEDALRKIYWENFHRMAGDAPKKVDIAKAHAYAERMVQTYEGAGVPYFDRVFPQFLAVRDILASML